MSSLNLQEDLNFARMPDLIAPTLGRPQTVFNILCIGNTGVGKSTLMNSLFETNFESTPPTANVSNAKLYVQTRILQDRNLQLTFVDTIDYDYQINMKDSIKSIENYINEQFELYLQKKIKGECLLSINDTRIHACMYIIDGLKPIDLMCMKAIDTKVNLIPVIAKADIISKSDLNNLKKNIITELRENDVKIYQFQTNYTKVHYTMNSNVLAAVIGNTDFAKVTNQTMQACWYPWGANQVENESHWDFLFLKRMFSRTNMRDLLAKTHEKHYKPYQIMRILQSLSR